LSPEGEAGVELVEVLAVPEVEPLLLQPARLSNEMPQESKNSLLNIKRTPQCRG
jgi:hypothetical protein